MFATEYERGPDLEHVSGRAGRAEQYAPLAQGLGHTLGGRSRRPTGFIDQFHAQQETFAPDVPDNGMPPGEFRRLMSEGAVSPAAATDCR